MSKTFIDNLFVHDLFVDSPHKYVGEIGVVNVRQKISSLLQLIYKDIPSCDTLNKMRCKSLLGTFPNLVTRMERVNDTWVVPTFVKSFVLKVMKGNRI
jgi:hypothetical protein